MICVSGMDFNEVTDSDLWISSASIGVGCDSDCGWECDFHFCYVPDVIEEDAINEKSCVQVLKHLIAKADADISDLEDDLAILQSQLSWAEDDEHGKLYEEWCVTFREKIKSLNTLLQTLRKGNAPSSQALNADSETHHKPAERIHDIISALLARSLATDSKEGNCNPLVADMELQEKTTAASVSLGLSRNPDEMKISKTENQLMTGNFSGTRGLHIPEVRLTAKHGHEVLKSASKEEKNSQSQCDRHKALDNDVKGGSFALQGAKVIKRSESMLFQQDCKAKDELTPALRAHPLQSTHGEVDFDENEPLAMLFNSQGSKRKKFQSNQPARSKRKILQEGNRQKLCMNDLSAAGVDARSKPSLVSEGSRRKAGTGRTSAAKKLPLRASEDSDLNSEPARDTRSTFALSAEIKVSTISSHSADLQRDEKYSTVGKHRQEPAASEPIRYDLKKMKRQGLMAMAKSHGLKGYHKLKKCLIVDMITRQLG